MSRNFDAAARFDDSFLSHMVRDFFFVLLAVIIAELGLRFAMVWYDFHHESKRATERAAEQLAADVKSIMLNSGGPVAARTVYPILKNNFNELGYAIAIEPSALTVAAIDKLFSFKARGIAADWPEGQHHEARVALVAEQFCTSCHLGATPGDVLGTVIVRSYLTTHLSHWWAEVQLASLLGMGKIILHTVVLFFLLKIRMEPLLSLRAMISLLAKGASDLSHRAAVKSHDEFGELARDLNLFLDRIDHVVEDLGSILTRIGALNQRLNQVHTQMLDEYHLAASHVQSCIKQHLDRGDSSPWLNAMSLTLATLQSMAAEKALPEPVQRRLADCLDDLQPIVQNARREARDGTGNPLVTLAERFHSFSHFMREMAVLEEKMAEIAGEGRTLLERLRSTEPPGAYAAGKSPA